MSRDLSGDVEIDLEDFKQACSFYHRKSRGLKLFTPSQSDCLEYSIRTSIPGYLYLFHSPAQRDALIAGGYIPSICIVKPRHTVLYCALYSTQKLSSLESEIFEQ